MIVIVEYKAIETYNVPDEIGVLPNDEIKSYIFDNALESISDQMTNWEIVSVEMG